MKRMFVAKIKCRINKHVVRASNWKRNWSDGECWETNLCLVCGKVVQRNDCEDYKEI